MEYLKTNKTELTKDDIIDYIVTYMANAVPELDTLWKYYNAKNDILDRPAPDPNNPDNKIPISYGRKIVNTAVGYGYRPGYITHRPNIALNKSIEIEQQSENKGVVVTDETKYYDAIQKVFKLNNEILKTSRHGRNTCIFGLSYEVHYTDKVLENASMTAQPRFFVCDPREVILIYDYSPEPIPLFAIRFYKVGIKEWGVEYYTKTTIQKYKLTRKDETVTNDKNAYILTEDGLSYTNFYKQIPVVPYYFDDAATGIIRPVKKLIDAYDTLFSDSMNEFARFAYAYLLMYEYNLVDPVKKKEPGIYAQALALIKRYRVFENLKKDSKIEFLTKDIPTAFIQLMAGFLREQIHIQSHTPDFTNEKMAGASGVAIQRLVFDFENMISSAEADFDVGLNKRLELITEILKQLNRIPENAGPEMLLIRHKRNVPLNVQEFVQNAKTMKEAGFSSYAIVSMMPEEIIPNVELELLRQKKEQESLMTNDVEMPIDDALMMDDELGDEEPDEGA